MRQNTTKYAVSPEAHDVLSEIHILLIHAREARDYADVENDRRKRLAFDGMSHTFLITAEKQMEAFMDRTRRAKEEAE
jgi:hypothetical protein